MISTGASAPAVRSIRPEPVSSRTRRANSRAIVDLIVGVQAGPGRLSVTKSWPDFPAVHFLGRSVGYRPEDLEEIRTRLRDFVAKGV